MNYAAQNIHILQNTDLFEQRESGVSHTSYHEEIKFYSLIQHGNTEMVRQVLAQREKTGIVIGHLSNNSVRQMQYWAVCTITLAIRYAIQGGLDEMTAFNLSDKYIMHIDELANTDDIINYLSKCAIELSEMVRKNAHGSSPVQIRKCLNYIDKNLNKPLRIAQLAEYTNLSSDYLAKLFKKYVGKTIGDYIMEKKLETAKFMLQTQKDTKKVAYMLGFCSQTHFITCFKKAYGITPYKYATTANQAGN